MKNPNGYGTVVKLSGKRRRPFVARVTVGFDEFGRQKQKAIGYFETRRDALDALSIYNLSKTDEAIDESRLPQKALDGLKTQIFKNQPTVGDLYDIVFEETYSRTSASNQREIKSAYKNLKPIMNIRIGNLTIRDVQDCIDILKPRLSTNSLGKHKTLVKRIMAVAIREGHIKPSDDFSRYIDVTGGISAKSFAHVPFSSAEILKVFDAEGRDADIVKCLILTGCRPNELFGLDDSQFHTDEDIPYIVTGSKTDAGKDRVVPIHPAIMPCVGVLRGLKINVDNFRNRNFYRLMDQLGMDHRPYDCRHTFASLAQYFDMDPYCRKKIMGHRFNDLTNDVYTHSYIEKLYRELCKIDLEKLPE